MKLFEEYQKFIENHPKQSFEYQSENILFRYFGNGEKVILVLLGTSMFPNEAYFRMLNTIKKNQKILTIDYPKSSRTIKELMKIIAALMDNLKINKVIVLGASHGGGLAQAFAKYYSNQVESMILFNTLTKTTIMNEASKNIIDNVINAINQLSELRKIMPLQTIKKALLDQIHDALNNEEALDLFENIIELYTEADERIQMQLIKDFLTNYTFDSIDFKYLKNQVLILYGNDDDPFGGTELIETLADLFTSPKLVFIEATRFSLILDSDEFIKSIELFINEKPLN